MRSIPVTTTLLAVCLSLTLVGCSGGAATAPDSVAPSATSSPPPSATPIAVPPETLPAAPQLRKSPAGQKAFARYVVDAWGYALRTNDASPLLALSPKRQPCQGCKELAAELEQRSKAGWHVDFPGAQISSVKLTRKVAFTVATAAVSIPESDSYNDDGSFRNTSPAHANGSFQVRMRLIKGAYQLVSFTVS